MKTNQKQTLQEFEQAMSLGPVACAAKLDTSYDTYKAWKSGRNKMPGCAYVAIGLRIAARQAGCAAEPSK